MALDSLEQKTRHLGGFQDFFWTLLDCLKLCSGAQERTRTSTVLPAST